MNKARSNFIWLAIMPCSCCIPLLWTAISKKRIYLMVFLFVSTFLFRQSANQTNNRPSNQSKLINFLIAFSGVFNKWTWFTVIKPCLFLATLPQAVSCLHDGLVIYVNNPNNLWPQSNNWYSAAPLYKTGVINKSINIYNIFK